MRRAGLIAWLMLAMALWQGPAWAVLPGEALSDPALEARARALSAELRCMVCQNQSIDLSDAELAHDLRVLVRERLMAGDSDEEVLDYVVSRYGEFVLLKPRYSLRNALLWGTPVLLLVAGAGVLLYSQRRRKAGGTTLSAEESAELDRILAETPKSTGTTRT
jgi:cytochrome c-type biogenesis protein CcmH